MVLDACVRIIYAAGDGMEVRFEDADLDRLETDARFTARKPPEVVTAYRKVLHYIRQAIDERDLRAWPSLHFEKYEDFHSLRLNRQWRMVIDIEGEAPRKTIVIKKVENYHKD